VLDALIFHRVSDGLLVTGADGALERVNPAAAAMLGQSIESLLGQHPRAVFRHNPALVNLCTRVGEHALDVRLPRRRLISGTSVTLEGERRLIVLHDVTERRDLDSRREQLIAAFSHDLRNPLAALSGFIELIGKSGPMNDEQAHFAHRARQMAVKLHDIVTALADLAWLESGMPIEHVPVQMATVIESAIASVEPMAAMRGLTIAVSMQKPLPLVMGDPARIGQVVAHLLRNALLYSEPERLVAVHAWGDQHEVYCSVADQGYGIDDEELELVFDRLYRSPDPRVQAVAGDGLGLTLARRIVVRHGGDLWAASNLGRGSTFTFMLPAAHGV
jgi:PAS domain S-box-containing protein